MPDSPDIPRVRPDPTPRPDLPDLNQSGTHTLDDGTVFTYSTLADYVEHYVRQGLVKDLDDLVANFGHLIPEIFFHWVGTGQLGCLFAVKLSRKPRENLWMPIVQLNALTLGNKLGSLLNATLDAASEGHEAAVVIFPDITTGAQIVEVVNALCNCPSGRWYRTDDGIDPDPKGNLHLVGLRWILKESTSVNYVLGFANIDTMSFTRQSPFMALFLRIKEEKRTDKHQEDGRVQVHLADLDSTFRPQAVHDLVWEQTKKHRKKFVDADKSAGARARVTFAFSADTAAKLCPPKKVALVKAEKPTKQAGL